MSGQSVQSPWGQALLSLILYLIYRFFQSVDASPFYLWLFGGASLLCLFLTIRGLVDAFGWWRLVNAMKKPIGIYGQTEFPTARDAEDIGLSFSNEDGNGIPLASVGDKIIYWHGRSHMSVRAPTEGGKTESSAANICFALGGHRNIICTAKGAELAWLCGPYREKLGQNIIYINPWRLMKEHGLPFHDFNPVGHLPKLAEQGDAELIDKARGISQILLAESETGSGDNKIFRSQGRDILTWCLIYTAILEADTGELCCNLPYLYNVLCGSSEVLINLFDEMSRCYEFGGTVSRAGGRFLGKMQRSPKSAESFLTEAQDALQIYDPASMLGRSMEYSDFDPSDLKNPDKPTTVFIIIPPEKALTHGAFAGLCLNTLIDTCIELDNFEPRVTVVADEFPNLSEGKLPAILPTLYIGRSRGVQLITYVQDTESYSRYGREASAFTTQSEIVMAWGIRSTKDAEEYSKRSGQLSIMSESGTIPMAAEDGKYSLGISEKGIPNLRPDEFMHLPDFTAVIFYKQNPPIIVDLVSYRMVDPWCYQATPVPGSPSMTDVPVKFRA